MGHLAARGQSQARVLSAHRVQVIDICARYGAVHVRVFGSVARGAAGPDSDIDLIVDYDSGSGLMPLIGLREELTALLGYDADVVPLDLLRPAVAASALADARPV